MHCTGLHVASYLLWMLTYFGNITSYDHIKVCHGKSIPYHGHHVSKKYAKIFFTATPTKFIKTDNTFIYRI